MAKTPSAVEWGTRAPDQGGETECQRQAGDGIAEQLGKQGRGCAGLAGLALVADLQGGLIEHYSHLGLLLRRSLRVWQEQGLGDVGGTKHGPLEFL